MTEYYTYSDVRSNPDYILDNYVGQQRTNQTMRRSLLNNRLSTPSSDTVSSSAESEISASNNNYGNFADGTFEELGSLQQQIASTIFPDIDDPAVQNWIAQIQNPAELVSFIWDVTGNVQLVRDGNNTLIELTQTNDTSLGQLLNLNNNPNSLEFDLSILSVGTDDKIQVIFNSNVLTEFALTSLPPNGHYSVSLSEFGFQSGELTFRLVGPTDTPSVVRLDNLSVLDVVSSNTSPILQSSIPNKTVIENRIFNFTIPDNRLIDPDNGDKLTYSTSTLPTWLTFDSTTRNFTGNPTDSDVGTYDITVTATDNAGASVSDTFVLTVLDFLPGTSKNETITGTSENEALYGKAGNDTLLGGEGNDQLNGGIDSDSLVGGTGNDLYFIDNVGDIVVENFGEGIDTVKSLVSYTLTANVEKLILTGTNSLSGTGNNLGNVIQGNSGDNLLQGLKGSDTLNGGAGNDTLTGDEGRDTFRFASEQAFTTSDFGVDTITDFTSTKDKIVLSKTSFITLSTPIRSNLQASDFAVINTELANEINDASGESAKIIYNSATNNLLYNENGLDSGLGNGEVFATLEGTPLLNNNDFWVGV